MGGFFVGRDCVGGCESLKGGFGREVAEERVELLIDGADSVGGGGVLAGVGGGEVNGGAMRIYSSRHSE